MSGPQVGLREASQQPGRSQDADRLDERESEHDAQRDPVAEALGETAGAADGHAGSEEREYGDRDASGHGPEAVLEVLGKAGASVAAHDRRK